MSSGNTSSTEVSSTFSFRMFDMYRRFIEILRLNPAFLDAFKTGHPETEICQIVVKRSFCHRQPEERIINLVQYLKNNARAIASHVEKIPSNWDDAIKYTNNCIKLVKKVLHEKGIVVKTFDPDPKKVDELADEIAVVLHNGLPTNVQLQAIKDYLMYDLKNPKKTIISSTPKTLKCRKKEATRNYKIKNLRKHRELKMKIKKEHLQNSETNGLPNNSESDNIVYKTEIVLDTPKSNNASEEYSTISCDSVSRKLIQLGVAKSENEAVYESTNNGSGCWTKGFYKISKENLEHGHHIKSVLKNSCNESFDSNESFINDGDLPENSYIKKEHVDCTWNLKRKVSFNSHNYNNNSQPKKLMTDNSFVIQNDTENNYHETLDFKKIMEPIIEMTEKNEIIDLNDINNKKINNRNTCQKKEHPIHIVHTQKDVHKPPLLKVGEVKFVENIEVQALNDVIEPLKNDSVESTKQESIEKNPFCTYKSKLYRSVFNTFTSGNDVKVESMTYSKMHELMETAMAFCEKKPTQIDLEEFLFLRRFRDKMLWLSMKEIKTESL